MDPQPYQLPTRYSHTYSRDSPSRSYTDYNQSSIQKTQPSTLTHYTPYPTSVQNPERKSIKRTSPSRIESVEANSRPPRAFRDAEVLSKVNEALMRSAKILTAHEAPLQKKTYSQTVPHYTRSEQSATTKQQEILQRVNGILKRPSEHLRETGNYSADKAISFIVNPPIEEVPEQTSRDSVNNHSFFPVDGVSKSNANKPAIASSADKRVRPGSLISRADEALQGSSQITADVGSYSLASYSRPSRYVSPARDERRLSQDRHRQQPESQNLQETIKKYTYMTPQRLSHNQRTPQETFQVSNEPIRPSSVLRDNDNLNFVTKDRQNLDAAYEDAIRRSEELARRSEEELQKSLYKAQQSRDQGENSLRSSVTVERQVNSRGASPKRIESESIEKQTVDLRDVNSPGLYIPAQGQRPKFVEEYYNDGSIYRGEKIREEKHGRGEFSYVDGERYDGEWEHGKRCGYGVSYFADGNIQYDGEWKDDFYSGNGVLVNGDAMNQGSFNYRNFDTLDSQWIKYEGEFLAGKMHGIGTLTFFNNERYHGKFKYDRIHGVGVFNARNGETVSGEWEDNKFMRATLE